MLNVAKFEGRGSTAEPSYDSFRMGAGLLGAFVWLPRPRKERWRYDSAGCCWLLAAAGCCWLLSAAGCCNRPWCHASGGTSLLAAAGCWLLLAAADCCLLLAAATDPGALLSPTPCPQDPPLLRQGYLTLDCPTQKKSSLGRGTPKNGRPIHSVLAGPS